jgi:branched-chain amino acid transport system ATP-binding protein
MSLLVLDTISKSYDGVRALNRVSLTVRAGTIKGLIGPNGAGKTTLFHLISGMESPSSGTISFRGVDITGKAPHEIAALGVGRTFQTIQTWGNMTVVENILAGMHTRIRGNFLSCGFWLPWIHKGEKGALQEAKRILEFLGPRNSPSVSRRCLSWGGRWPCGRSSCCWTSRLPA